MKTRSDTKIRMGVKSAALIIAGLLWMLILPQNVQAQSTITEVSVEHTACHGFCPVYKLTLKRDGTAIFVGSQYTDKVGTYQAQFGRMERLFRAIDQRSFQRLKPKYTSPVTDLPHTITTVVQGGQRKAVDNYADTGPQALWEIQTLIDGAVAEVHWKKVSNSTEYH